MSNFTAYLCPYKLNVSVSSTVVEPATHMRVYAGSSPTRIDYRTELV